MARRLVKPQKKNFRVNFFLIFAFAFLFASIAVISLLTYKAAEPTKNSGKEELFLALLSGFFQLMASLSFSKVGSIDAGLAWTAVKNLGDLHESVAHARERAEKLANSNRLTIKEAQKFVGEMSILLDTHELQIAQAIENWNEVNPDFYTKLKLYFERPSEDNSID